MGTADELVSGHCGGRDGDHVQGTCSWSWHKLLGDALGEDLHAPEQELRVFHRRLQIVRLKTLRQLEGPL